MMGSHSLGLLPYHDVVHIYALHFYCAHPAHYPSYSDMQHRSIVCKVRCAISEASQA
jgi:hypothetical protein